MSQKLIMNVKKEILICCEEAENDGKEWTTAC